MTEKSKNSLGARLEYWFDRTMARGMVAKIRLLLIATVVFVLVVGLLAFAAADPGASAPAEVWKAFLMSLGKGGLGDVNTGSPLYMAIMLVVVLYAMFFTAILIGLISTGIRSKIDDLGKGHGSVLESGHVLILGFNESTYVLLDELIRANENQPLPQTVVVLDNTEQSKMEDAIRERFGSVRNYPNTRIICRTGSCYGLRDLQRCAICSCHSVIVNTATDFDAIKALMACTYLLNEEKGSADGYSVAVVHAKENEAAAKIAGCDDRSNDRLELFAMQETLARIIVHTSRQPGLASVFTELFNFAGHEFYIVEDDPAFPSLYDKTLEQVNLRLESATAVGVVNSNGEIDVGDPRLAVFRKGDSLVVIAEDDDALKVADTPAVPKQVGAGETELSGTMSSVILGAYSITHDVLGEYCNYLQKGSTIHVVDAGLNEASAVWEEWKSRFAQLGVDFRASKADVYDRDVLRGILDDANPDSVLILTNAECDDPEETDRGIVSLLLYLREYRTDAPRGFGITSQMNLEANRELAAATSADDFIVGRHFAALLMAQVSQSRKKRDLFDAFLAHEGFEVYIKKASNYVPLGVELDLYTVGSAVAARGDIFIGLRQKQNGRYYDPIINPAKRDPHTGELAVCAFGEDDYLVVLSEDMEFFLLE